MFYWCCWLSLTTMQFIIVKYKYMYCRLGFIYRECHPSSDLARMEFPIRICFNFQNSVNPFPFPSLLKSRMIRSLRIMCVPCSTSNVDYGHSCFFLFVQSLLIFCCEYSGIRSAVGWCFLLFVSCLFDGLGNQLPCAGPRARWLWLLSSPRCCSWWS